MWFLVYIKIRKIKCNELFSVSNIFYSINLNSRYFHVSFEVNHDLLLKFWRSLTVSCSKNLVFTIILYISSHMFTLFWAFIWGKHKRGVLCSRVTLLQCTKTATTDFPCSSLHSKASFPRKGINLQLGKVSAILGKVKGKDSNPPFWPAGGVASAMLSPALLSPALLSPAQPHPTPLSSG